MKAAILGAESFGFGTAPMVAMGCKFLRICHLNNCATGVATQDETLRKEYFKGLPEMVVNYFTGLADEVRELLAELGVEKLTDLIGRTDLLEAVEGMTAKQSSLICRVSLKRQYRRYLIHCIGLSLISRLIKRSLTKRLSKKPKLQ